MLLGRMNFFVLKVSMIAENFGTKYERPAISGHLEKNSPRCCERGGLIHQTTCQETPLTAFFSERKMLRHFLTFSLSSLILELFDS